MGKIDVLHDDDRVLVRFTEYADERQLKDLYKLYKKASGFVVSEYKEEDGAIRAITDNTSSVGIGRNAEDGCYISGTREDVRELLANVFDMLCYRYSSFRNYDDLVKDLDSKGGEELESAVDKITEEHGLEAGTGDDMKKLLRMARKAQDPHRRTGEAPNSYNQKVN